MSLPAMMLLAMKLPSATVLRSTTLSLLRMVTATMGFSLKQKRRYCQFVLESHLVDFSTCQACKLPLYLLNWK